MRHRLGPGREAIITRLGRDHRTPAATAGHIYAVNEDKKVYTRDANYNTSLWTTWKEIPGGATGVKAITAASTD
ncbi:hypothetical protein ADK60_37410 [Streptomyces sp. XY431]|uniref:hypothetical protein n=1 Tax=Streptomycetaceae TaxID=2062 RepID=UPI0006AF29F8|nr:hypothetical protein [Streptomyces sp. XY431]KOV10719.1 hypothetical protein ADK60_37410 [Streptomyces sp. XY431]